MTDSGLKPFAFVLAVPDLQKNVDYFRDALGFTAQWPQGADWQLMVRDGVRLMLGHCPDAISPSALGDHSYFAYLNVADVDALHDEWRQNGALILQPPADKPHGMREFLLATPDGHRLMVGQEI
ncbi:VOC family protein [Klebsiella sp. NPDC088457]